MSKSYRDQVAAIIAHPGASFWLKAAIKALDARDPVDAISDVEFLRGLQEVRLKEMGFLKGART